MIKSNTFYMMTIYKEFLYYTEKVLKEMKISFGQLPFILYIGKNENCTPSEVKNNLKMDWGYVQRSITKLEKDGFIYKYKDDSNKRGYCMKLTDIGDEAYQKCHDVFYSWDREIKGDLSEEEWDEFGILLNKIFENRKRGRNNEEI